MTQSYIVDSLEEAQKFIEKWEAKEGRKLKCMRMQKGFGNSSIFDKPHRVQWGIEGLENDLIPHLVLASKVFGCSDKKEKKKGGTAKIIIREIMKFPKYKLNKDTEKRRRTMSEKLRRDMKEHKDEGRRLFWVYFPTQQCHTTSMVSVEGPSTSDTRKKRKLQDDDIEIIEPDKMMTKRNMTSGQNTLSNQSMVRVGETPCTSDAASMEDSRRDRHHRLRLRLRLQLRLRLRLC